MSAQHTPGPWRPSRYIGDENYPAGWYCSRTNNGKTEWIRTADGFTAQRFKTEAEALAAIAKATGAAS